MNFSKYTCPKAEGNIEGTGIADCILISGDLIQVIDFKYGKGVPVSADHNPQLMLYALGAYEGCRLLYGIHRVKLSIVQPRLNNIDEWDCSLEDLLKFGDYVKMRQHWPGKQRTICTRRSPVPVLPGKETVPGLVRSQCKTGISDWRTAASD